MSFGYFNLLELITQSLNSIIYEWNHYSFNDIVTEAETCCIVSCNEQITN